MRLIALILFNLIFSQQGLAQTIIKVSPKEVSIKLDTISVNPGEQLLFLDENLDEVAKGEVFKLSPNNTTALVKILSGKVKKGMTVEKLVAPTEQGLASPKPNFTPYEDLSPEDQRILARGEISTASYVIGGILATYPLGLGIGHAVQGRYQERGWIFTLGEVSSVLVMLSSFGDCYDNETYGRCSSNFFELSVWAYFGFRIWEIIDAWAVPPQINSRYRYLRERSGWKATSLEPFIAPQENGAMAGLTLRF